MKIDENRRRFVPPEITSNFQGIRVVQNPNNPQPAKILTPAGKSLQGHFCLIFGPPLGGNENNRKHVKNVEVQRILVRAQHFAS